MSMDLHLDLDEVLDYALEGLEGERRERAEAHLIECAYCRAMLRDAMELHDGFASLAPLAPAPAGLVERIVMGIQGP